MAPESSAQPELATEATPRAIPDPAKHAVTLRQVMLLVIALQVLALLWLLPGDPMVSVRIDSLLHPQPRAPEPISTADVDHDPVAGSILPQGVRDHLLAHLPAARKAYLLVPVGDCASCLAADVAGWCHKAAASGVSVVLLTSASPVQAREFQKQSGITCPVVCDSKKELMPGLNIQWVARPYLFSRNWQFLWAPTKRQIMYDPFVDPEYQKALQEASR